MRRTSYTARKIQRRMRRPAELLLVPMIDIFTVLVTFLLMTAVFSRTVILQLNLPPPQTVFKEPPPGLQLELMVADRNSGPLHAVPNTAQGYDYDGLVEYLKFVKTKFPEKTEASILLEPDTAYDTLVQVMDHVRVFEAGEGANTVQAELFPDISIGDAPAPGTAATGPPGSGAPSAPAAPGSPPMAAAPVAHVALAAPPAPATGKGARP